MSLYENSLPVSEGLKKYFSAYKLGDGAYNSPTFKINYWGLFTLTFPNTKGRIKAVKLHDIHHVLNEYETKLKGEAEIGAWEVASGCGKYYAAWFLNFGAMLYGIFLYPKLTFTAFVKGRKCLNLYHGTEYTEELLNTSIGELRNKLHINSEPNKIKFTDILAYTFCVFLCLFVIFFLVAAIYLLVRMIL